MYAADRAVCLLSRFASFEIARGAIDLGGGRISPARHVPARGPASHGTQNTRRKECRRSLRASTFLSGRMRPADGASPFLAPVRHRKEIDLVEEVARLTGDKIPVTYPESGARFLADDTSRNGGGLRVPRCRGSRRRSTSFVAEKEWKRHAPLLGFDPADAIRLEPDLRTIRR
jgi:hypothetical protein